MAKNLELTIGPNYIPDWGAWEAIREFIQNTLDANQAGYKMDIRRNPNGTLVLRNEGARLQYSDLILGSSSKQDGEFRGQYGEGFKLAMMVLCRMARDNNSSEPPIRIKTGAEMWRPTLKKSATFGTEILNIEITNVQDDNGITVYIPNISDALWKIIQDRVLDLGKTMKISSSKYGDILLDQKNNSQLFVKGLWISEAPRQAKFGYNLTMATVDRDRKVAEYSSVTSALRYLLDDLVRDNKISGAMLLEILLSEKHLHGLEAECLVYSRGAAQEAICKEWLNQFGDAIPVSNATNKAKVETFGGRAVEVGYILVEILSTVASFDRFMAAQSFQSTEAVSVEEVGPSVKETIEKINELLPAVWRPSKIELVKFTDPNLNGTCDPSTGTVQISKSLLEKPAEFIATYIHECAHLDGSRDLSKRHAENIQNLAGMVIAKLLFG